MDNYEPTPFIIKISKPFRFLLESDFILIVSMITFVSLGVINPYHLPSILFIIFLLSGTLFMFSSITTAIAALYIFFKTIKKKGPTLHAYNVFSRYILIAALANFLFILISYSIAHFANYKFTNTYNNFMYTAAATIFSIINISGFIHLALLYRKYAKYMDSIQSKS